KDARRPPELLTRDHVSRCIVREIKEGRGSTHGGVYLDISWIKQKMPNAAEHIKRKLPSMYHQFKQLADIDITKEPMEVGPTTHYIMGGVRVNSDSQMSKVPGLFAAGECAAGINGANRLGGNSLSDLLVFGKRAGEYAAKFAKENKKVAVDAASAQRATDDALKPFEHGLGKAENPYTIQSDLQEMMQRLVGIVRTEAEMQEAITGLAALKVWRSDDAGGHYENFSVDVVPGMVVLDAIHQIQATQCGDLAVRWNCKAGKCGSCSAEINGNPRLMCMTRLNTLNLLEPVTVEPMRAFPPIKDLVTDVSWNFRVKKTIVPFTPRPADAADGTWRMRQQDVDRVQEFRKCIE